MTENPVLNPGASSKTQAERTAASDKAMLDAGISLLLERGTEGTTLAAIGERAGYSRGLATYRYGSKSGLFQEISNTVQRRWADRLNQALGARRGLEALVTAADAYYEFIVQSPRDIRVLHILYFAGVAPGGDVRKQAKTSFQAQIDDAQRWIEQGIEDGDIRDDLAPNTVATQYVAHLAGITYIWLLNAPAVDLAAMHQEFIKTIRGRLWRRESQLTT
ncbi:MAG: TetR/AcrR family transcriptional regulator [Pseudomonadota bacterium]